jgi:hypothetical protein
MHRQDHFRNSGFNLNDSADSGILSVGGAVLAHAHHDQASNVSTDHFQNNGMACGGSDVMMSANGSVMRGVAHAAAGRNQDHFKNGGMSMADSAVEPTHGRGHVAGTQAADHLSPGMAPVASGGRVSVADAAGNKLTHSHHAAHVDDHFGSGGAFVPAEGHGTLSAADEKLINKNKHFVHFYT